MSFSSHLFLFAFLPLALIGFRFTRGRGWADLWLVAMSLLFYAFAGAAALAVVVLSATGNYLVSVGLNRLQTERAKPWLLGSAVAANLLTLGYFKYFSVTLRALFAVMGVQVEVADTALPLGISFFTFQQIAYLVNLHARQAAPPRFRHYLLFVTFFPQAASGPINYWHETVPQYQSFSRRSGGGVDFSVGLTLFAFGLFKKAVLASSLAPFVDPVFDGPPRAVGVVEAWSAAFCYGLQLYLDFSGYSDMALGIARMFGIRLPPNFNSPLRAASLIDFWRRWHMTMTRFFTDFVYSPIALRWTRQSLMRRDSKWRQFLVCLALPTAITFVVIGWWHGPNWTYILFGTMQALGMIANHAWRQAKWPAPPRWLGHAFVFFFFIITEVTFRAPTIESAVSIYVGMFAGNTHGPTGLANELLDAWVHPATVQGGVGFRALVQVSTFTHAPELLVYIVLLTAFCTLTPNALQVLSRYRPALTAVYRDYAGTISWRPTLVWAFIITVTLLLGISEISRVQPFIYVQF